MKNTEGVIQLIATLQMHLEFKSPKDNDQMLHKIKLLEMFNNFISQNCPMPPNSSDKLKEIIMIKIKNIQRISNNKNKF